MSDKPIDINRFWKDEDYRQSLSEAELSQLPSNPAGMIELPDEDMESIVAGRGQSKKGSCQTCYVTGGRKCSKKGTCIVCPMNRCF